MARYMLIMRSTPEAEAAMAERGIDFDSDPPVVTDGPYTEGKLSIQSSRLPRPLPTKSGTRSNLLP